MTAEAIDIYPLTIDDFDAWLPLWQAYLRFYNTRLAEEAWAATFARLCDPAEPMWGWIARQGSAAVGLVHAIRHRSTWTSGDYCYLQDLFTVLSARNRGVGSALINEVYAFAREQQCSRVYWLTHETNVAAIKLYEQLAERSGFVQYRKLL